MDSSLKLKIKKQKKGKILIDLDFTTKRHNKIINHILSLSKEELEQAELQLGKVILEMERRKND